MKIFMTKSPLVVKNLQGAFGFVSIIKQIDIRTATFFRRYASTDNAIWGALAMFADEHLRRLSVSTDV
jgi:hypothetical protein